MAVDVVKAIEQASQAISKLMDKIPNYDQRKKKKYYKLKRSLNEQRKLVYPKRDDELILNLADELYDLGEIFYKEIFG